MSSVALYLLGCPRTERDHRPVSLGTRKATALLAYLAVTGRAHQREHLATLLWPESDSAHGRGALRRTLAAVRAALGAGWLETAKETIGLPWGTPGLWIDVATFQNLIDSCRGHHHPAAELGAGGCAALEQAVDLYRDDLLTGFSLKDSPEFDRWLLTESERLRAEVLAGLARLVRHHGKRGTCEAALGYARRWLALDPLSEAGHREAMRLLAWTGQRSAAFRQFEECRRLLADELGAQPLPETEALCEEIRTGRLAGPPPSAADEWDAAGGSPATVSVAAEGSGEGGSVGADLAAAARGDRGRAPAVAEAASEGDAFVGRSAELSRIHELLAETSECRLLTLLGPGGIGKTRLALRATTLLRPAFRDGVHLLSLAAAVEAPLLVAALAETLGLAFPGASDPRPELLAALRGRQALLVLDNGEHLLGAAGLLGEILDAAPGVKLLATSRERLALAAEWILDVPGLDFPEREDESDPLAFAAVRLFLAQARKVRPDLPVAEATTREVGRICRLTRGMPLALELAAPWVRVLPLSEIGDELAAGFDLLASTRRDLPERHRSMRAVFEESWERASDEERATFRALSVFRGGFRRAAAERVAGARLPLLAALADRSLLKRSGQGRYEIHELLRQYGEEKLGQETSEARRLRERHALFYAGLLEERATALRGAAQRSAVAEIGEELENVRAAWRFLVDNRCEEALGRAAEALFHFYELRGWFQEGAAAFEAAVLRLGGAGLRRPAGARRRALARCLIAQASFGFRLGDYECAGRRFEEARALAAARGAAAERGLSLVGLGLVAKSRGEYERGARSFEEALRILDRADFPWGAGLALQALGDLAYGTGDHRRSRALLGEGLAIFRVQGDRRMVARLLVGLARAASLSGEHAESRRLLEESLAACRQIDDRWGEALSLQRLGAVAEKAGEPEEARRHFEESLATCRQVGDRRGAVVALTALGQRAGLDGRLEEARGHFAAALATAVELGAAPLVLGALAAAVPMLVGEGRVALAAEVAAAAADHPAASRETRDSAARLAPTLARRIGGELPRPRPLGELAAAVRGSQAPSLSR